VSHAYCPGLRASEWVALRRERLLPGEGEVLVRAGQVVAPDTVVARTILRGTLSPVNVAASLGVEPGEVAAALLKRAGEAVRQGELLARTKGVFGLLRAECRAPVTGTLASISVATGQVMIEGPPLPVEVRAYLAGTVTQVRPGRGATIAAGGTWIQGIFGIGGETWGALALGLAAPGDRLTEAAITPDLRGKIVVGGGLVTLGALARAAQLGVGAIITGGVHAIDLGEFMGGEIGAGVTGAEQVGLTLIVTEGFGEIAMAGRTFHLLGQREGLLASVSGATQIRSGVLRPEIIVPATSGQGSEEDVVAADGIVLGTTVRLVRAPYFGQLGTVVALPPDPCAVASGSLVRILEAELESGARVTVPRSNVELF
jgi:hypothetical protein